MNIFAKNLLKSSTAFIMMKSLTEIKRLRKKYGLSQKELSKFSGVSQSLIAKIESKKVEPTYSKAVDLFNALESISQNKESCAKDLMVAKIFTVSKDTSVVQAIRVIKKHNVSQLPVMEDHVVCGLISESVILEKTLELDGKISNIFVGHVMVDAPPIISMNTRLRTIVELLCDQSIVLVQEKGKLKGIIAKADVLGLTE